MQKRRILVVDDEPAFTRFVKAALEETGAYEVRGEVDAGQALGTAKAFKPDLVFMDVMIPPMEGGEVAAQFQADSDLKEVPVIFLTGAVTQAEVSQGGGLIGGRPFLAKPVTPANLVATIERYFPLKG
ncbi:MAG: response regulator [Deltaproteobacteria bacterium]|nr:response regulator [Deltaproteobacteria bacterium]